MSDKPIIYHHYSDYVTKKLEHLIKLKLADGDSFGARILQTRLERWIRAATSDEVNRQIQGSFKSKMKQHKKSGGRERFTLRDLNRLRKEKLALTRVESDNLLTKETMYGNKYTAK